MKGSKKRFALPAVALLACGAGVGAMLWFARSDVAPPAPATAAGSPERSISRREATPSEGLLSPPEPTPPGPEPDPSSAAPQSQPAATPAPAEPQSILEETEAYWQQRYGESALPELRRDLDALRTQFLQQSNAEYDRRFDSGEYELVVGASEPRNDPWTPGAFLQMERPGGEAADEVHRVVLYQYEAPELYAMAAKIYWLEQRVEALAPPAGDGR